jgi:phosphatidylserine/phosphatidylglycerophosphate/cardiolipin synthase-like enzyme
VDSVLVTINPLVDLLSRAEHPHTFADELLSAARTGGPDIAALWQTCDRHARDPELVGPVLAAAGVLDRPSRHGQLADGAAVRIGQAQAVLADRLDDQWELVLTVPGFLRDRLKTLDGPRPRETSSVITDVAASARDRLVIAAPYLHTGFIQYLVEPVRTLLHRGGQVVVITRALSLRAPAASSANLEAVEQIRQASSEHSSQLRVCSWEERGLGIHFKAVVADGERAYLGSSNLTPGGAAGHAEGGVRLRSSRVATLDSWLMAVADELEQRRLPHG